jgi:hypothetical protein
MSKTKDKTNTKKSLSSIETKGFSAASPEYFSAGDERSGPEGARTPDLLHAMEALSQLRYRPAYVGTNSLGTPRERSTSTTSVYTIANNPDK